MHPIAQQEQVGDVVTPLGEHVVHAAELRNAHVLDPTFGANRIGGPARPAESVGRRGVAQVPRCAFGVTITGVPEVVQAVFVNDVAPLANLAVPRVAACGRKHWIVLVGRPVDQFARKENRRPGHRGWGGSRLAHSDQCDDKGVHRRLGIWRSRSKQQRPPDVNKSAWLVSTETPSFVHFAGFLPSLTTCGRVGSSRLCLQQGFAISQGIEHSCSAFIEEMQPLRTLGIPTAGTLTVALQRHGRVGRCELFTGF